MDKVPHRVGVLVFPGVTLLDVAGPTEAFTEANRYGASYSTVLVSADGGPVRSSTGMEFSADRAVAGAGRLDTLLVPGSDAVAARPVDPALAAAAAQLAARAERVASVCTGAFVLAAAGLLDGRRATTHWRHAAACSDENLRRAFRHFLRMAPTTYQHRFATTARAATPETGRQRWDRGQ